MKRYESKTETPIFIQQEKKGFIACSISVFKNQNKISYFKIFREQEQNLTSRYHYRWKEDPFLDT